MASTDLAKISEGIIGEEHHASTVAGKVLGIIAVVIGSLVYLCCFISLLSEKR
jgi:hypothetical protein